MFRQKTGPCGCIALIIGFGFFSIIWDLAVEAWGLSHNQVLLIFFGIAVVVAGVVGWVVEEGWPDFLAWLADRRRARRGKDL